MIDRIRPAVSGDLAEIMRHQSLLLPAVAQALDYDLALAPVLLVDGNQSLVDAAVKGVAEMIGGDAFNLTDMTRSDIDAICLTYTGAIVVTLQSDSINLVKDVLLALEEATSPVVAIINVPTSTEAAMVTAIADSTGVASAHIPTARLGSDPHLVQPITITGAVECVSSESGRYDFTVAMDPHGAELHFSVHADEGMDDDAFLDRVEDLMYNGSIYALRLEDTEDGIICRIGDWELIDRTADKPKTFVADRRKFMRKLDAAIAESMED